MAAMPNLERIETCCITDWSAKNYYANMTLPTTGHALLHGSMEWEPGGDGVAPALSAGSNKPGTAPIHGMRSRTGLLNAESAVRASITVKPCERILVLGDGSIVTKPCLLPKRSSARGA